MPTASRSPATFHRIVLFNPVPLKKLAEAVRTILTSGDEVGETAVDLPARQKLAETKPGLSSTARLFTCLMPFALWKKRVGSIVTDTG